MWGQRITVLSHKQTINTCPQNVTSKREQTYLRVFVVHPSHVTKTFMSCNVPTKSTTRRIVKKKVCDGHTIKRNSLVYG